jgi:outer membrane protein assembly factor BamD
MSFSGVARSAVLVLCVATLATTTTGCRTHRNRQQQSSPEVLYKTAHSRLVAYDYNAAVKGYEQLTARYPFTDEARQARLDLIYAYYRQGESESATDAAETFIRENPAHPRVDYAWYVKGLVDFERTPNAMERLFRADLTERPPTTARKSFDAFKTVVEQYPKSPYAHDARQRMIYLRNRLANYDVHVAEYYLRRGAYVAAAQRSTHAIEQYDGAPVLRDAVAILISAQDRLGLKDRADFARQVYQLNFPNQTAASATQVHHWWQFWKK